MRLLRELPDEASAQRLVDALSDQGIESELKHGPQNLTVWVIEYMAKIPATARLGEGDI